MSGVDIEWPTADDVSVSFHGSINSFLVMTAEERGVYSRLVWSIANNATWGRYSNRVPDAGIPTASVQRYAGCDEATWVRVRGVVLAEFYDDGALLRLRDESIVRFSKRSLRSAIPSDVKAAVLAREGRRCAYCGNTDGPFHFDHLFPVSRGGTNDASNIVVACQDCNLSKSDLTILEWTALLRSAR